MGVVMSQGLPGSLRYTNDAAGGGEVAISASQGLLGDPRVLGCTGCTGIDSGDSGDDTIEDSCKIKQRSSHFEDLRSNHTHPQCLDVLKDLCDKGFIS